MATDVPPHRLLEPSLAAPENTAGSQVVYTRGNDQDGEAEAHETVLPEVAAEDLGTVIEIPPLR